MGQIEDVPDEVTEAPSAGTTGEAPATDPGTPEVVAPATSGELAGMTEGQLANEALASYDRAQTALQAGDWTSYGEEQERLGQVLEALAAVQQSTPAP